MEKTMNTTTANAQNSQNTYVLNTGEAGATRLNMQGELMRVKSQEHLLKAGLTRGQVVYDVGCGNGIMTLFMASGVGTEGHVYAVDASAEQLKVAEKNIKEAGHDHVTFIQANIEMDPIPKKAKADLVYARLFLMHLKDPAAGLERMQQLLKPNGIIVLQEPVTSTCRVSADNRQLKLIQCMKAMGDHLGLDYDIGARLKSLLEANSFKNIQQYEHQPEVDPEFARDFLMLVHQELANKVFELKLATEEEYEAWGKEIQALNSSLLFSKGVYLTAHKI